VFHFSFFILGSQISLVVIAWEDGVSLFIATPPHSSQLYILAAVRYSSGIADIALAMERLFSSCYRFHGTQGRSQELNLNVSIEELLSSVDNRAFLHTETCTPC
jgi:hypothetical protein